MRFTGGLGCSRRRGSLDDGDDGLDDASLGAGIVGGEFLGLTASEAHQLVELGAVCVEANPTVTIMILDAIFSFHIFTDGFRCSWAAWRGGCLGCCG